MLFGALPGHRACPCGAADTIHEDERAGRDPSGTRAVHVHAMGAHAEIRHRGALIIPAQNFRAAKPRDLTE